MTIDPGAMKAWAAWVVGFAIAGFLITRCSSGSSDALSFEPWDQAAFEAARKAGQPTLVYVSAQWDPSSREQRKVFLDPKVKEALAPFRRFKIDLSVPGPATEKATKTLDFMGLPAFTFAGRGKDVVNLVGLQTSESLIGAATTALRP